MKFGFDWPSCFREDVLNIMVIYMYIAPGQGQTTPQWLKFSININLLSIWFKLYFNCIDTIYIIDNGT